MLFLTTIDLSVCLLCITKHTPKFCLFVILNIKMKSAGGTELAKYKVALEQLNQNEIIEQTKLEEGKGERILVLM